MAHYKMINTSTKGEVFQSTFGVVLFLFSLFFPFYSFFLLFFFLLFFSLEERGNNR